VLTLASLQLALVMSPIDICCSPIVAGVALDGKGWRVVQLFQHANVGGFLLLQQESGEYNIFHTPLTLRSSHPTTGDCTETSSTNRDQELLTEKVQKDSYWLESEEDKLESIQRILVGG
jgi:hypothetical protein